MNRRGVALLLVLLAMLITAAMTAAVLAATSSQARATGEAQQSLRVAEAAERGHILAAASWQPESSLTMVPGTTMGPIVTAYPDSTMSRVWISRMAPGSFWITAHGREPGIATPIPVESRIGVLYGLQLPDVRLTAAVSVRDSLLVAGSATVDGTDTPAPGWPPACSTRVASIAATAAPDTTTVVTSLGSLLGNPAKLQDSTAALGAVIRQFGPVTWSSLAAHATYVIPASQAVTPAPSLTGAACDSLAPNNWGDPSRSTPCRNRFVIVHALGDVVMDAGSGQGIILAEGDVELRNGAHFAGLILARDDVVALTGANRISGGLLAADARRGNGDFTVIADATAVTYSSCSVEMALLGTAQMRRMSQRGWVPIH